MEINVKPNIQKSYWKWYNPCFFFFTFIQISLQERKEAEPQHLITLQTFIFNPSCLHSLFQRSVLPPIFHWTCYISDAPCKSLMRFDTGVSFAILIWPLCLQHTHSHIHTHTKRKEAKVKQNVCSRCPPVPLFRSASSIVQRMLRLPFSTLIFSCLGKAPLNVRSIRAT